MVSRSGGSTLKARPLAPSVKYLLKGGDEQAFLVPCRLSRAVSTVGELLLNTG